MRVKCEYRTTQKDVFKRFKEKYPQYKDIDFNTWVTVIYNFNYAFRDHLLETGEKCKFIYGFGEFTITKWKPRKTVIIEGEEKINLPVDWKKTNEFGRYIYHLNYHTDGYKFKWKWFYKSARFYTSNLWNFKPSRVTSRLLKHYLTLPDYKEKYLSWNIK